MARSVLGLGNIKKKNKHGRTINHLNVIDNHLPLHYCIVRIGKDFPPQNLPIIKMLSYYYNN